VGFDGTETASIEPSETHRGRGETERLTLTDDQSLCTRAGFCGNRVTNIWKLLEKADDSRVRWEIIQRADRCPSGRLAYEIDGAPIEPDLPRAVAVTKDGPYWVTGGIPVTLSDGRTLEVRNRVELCRCGQSSNKPLCDGTHWQIKFREG
jgi:CDGSH-type Zn-finger protein